MQSSCGQPARRLTSVERHGSDGGQVEKQLRREEAQQVVQEVALGLPCQSSFSFLVWRALFDDFEAIFMKDKLAIFRERLGRRIMLFRIHGHMLPQMLRTAEVLLTILINLQCRSCWRH